MFALGFAAPAAVPARAQVSPAAPVAAPTSTPEPPAPEPSPLQRLAERLAGDVARAARDLPVELAPIEDRTSAGGLWASDLRALLAGRLHDRLARPGETPRARVVAILSQAGPRLIVAARVEELPAGALLDLVSASAEIDPSLLALAPATRVAEARPVEVASSTRTVPLDERILDLAWVDGERLLLLSPGALALYRWVGTSFTLQSRQPLPAPYAPVRAPGGLLLPVPRERAVWALTSVAGQAALFAVDGTQLVERGRADALPWPNTPRGLRFRAGTNLIEATLPGLGGEALLAFEPAWPDAAVSAGAELLMAGDDEPRAAGLRVGPALAPLWAPLVAAASPDPPGVRDEVLLLRREGTSVREVGRLTVDGAVRALGSLPERDGARLVAGVEEPGGAFHLEVFDLRRPEAGAELP